MTDPNSSDESRKTQSFQSIKSGSYRPSKQVDLTNFDAIRRRQELNFKLLQRTCANDDETPPPTFEPEDVKVLIQIARERIPAANPLIRKQAVQALGQFRSLEVTEVLWELAASDSEHETIRGRALTGLVRITPKMALTLIQRYLKADSTLIRYLGINALAEIRDEVSLKWLRELMEQEQDSGVYQRAETVLQTIATHLGLHIPETEVRQRSFEKRTPTRES